MSDAESSADVPPSEPGLIARAQADGELIPAVEIESLQILVRPPAQGNSTGDLSEITGVSTAPAEVVAPEARGNSELLLQAVSRVREQLDRRLDSLQALFEREQRAEAARERVVDRLHAELQEYKQDLLMKVQRPIFIDLIQLHDDIGKLFEAQPADDAGVTRASAVRDILESIRTGIEDILYRQGVEPFASDGTDFDPRRQRAVSTVPTDNPALGKTVAIRLRKGFHAGEKVIRPEIVSVYAFRQTKAPLSQES
jgi:molecular chaperone GrpE